MLFDIDTDEGENIECKNYNDVLNVLYKLDAQFRNAEIVIRHSSSSHIYKWDKADKEIVKGAGSYHVYVKAKSVDSNLESYINALKDKAFEQGYGYFKVSKSGAMLKRQVFDSTVFSPERLVFESGMNCEAPYEQELPEAHYQSGGYIDCKYILVADRKKVQKKIVEAKDKKEKKADEISASYVQKEEENLVNAGCTPSEAKQKVQRLLSDSVLPSSYSIRLDDGNQITVQDIFLNPKKYNEKTCYDPLEAEKGHGKAIIFSNDGLNPIINSFVHGGVKYKLEADYETIYSIAQQAENNEDVIRITKLVADTKLPNDNRRKLGVVLKDKKLISSINALLITENELIQQKEAAGYIDISDKGKVHPTLANLRVLMDINNMSYQYDVILKDAKIQHSNVHQDSPNMESAVISEITGFAYNEEINPRIVEHLPALANKDYSNPLMEFVTTSHKGYDSQDYIAQVVNTLTTDGISKVYLKEVLIKWFVQCISAWDYERTSPRKDAKAKFESVLVFQGKQGVQKTKFFSALLPKDKEHYIKTGAMLNPTDKDSLMQNTSYGIVELGELESTFNKADIGALKAFLSNSLDEYRVPYGKTSTRNKRCTSFCGSVNERGFLRDPTGARRFWVVPIVAIDFISFEKINKSMLWAQAYDLYMKGERWWFDETDTIVNKELKKLHNAHKSYSLADEICATIEEFNTEKEWMNVTEIFEKWTDTQATKKDKNDLANMLEDAEYERNSRKRFNIPTKHVVSATTPISSEDLWQ